VAPSLAPVTSQISSRISGFYQLSPRQRRELVARRVGLTRDESAALERGLSTEEADSLVENVVGVFSLPIGIATNFKVNGDDRLVPMAVEEPSVIAAASHGALMARAGGGFTAEADEPLMIGQIQVAGVALDDLPRVRERLLNAAPRIVAEARRCTPTLTALGGGAKEIEVRAFERTPAGPMLVVHLLVDCRDAMGANAVNTACEAVGPLIAEIAGARVVLRILSNLCDRRLVRARCHVPVAVLERPGVAGEEVAERIIEAHALAVVDPYRAATHNKGVMNGVDAVAVATGNDWRSVEAGAHAYAARSGAYSPLSEWRLAAGGGLDGELELPLALGTVGGGTRAFPAAAAALSILGARSSGDLAAVGCSVGLAQNLSALRALATEGIQPGHMALHARQVAVAAGARRAEDVARIAEQLVAEGDIRPHRARELVAAGPRQLVAAGPRPPVGRVLAS
jgi:hydroxymethylglutaryl-CoA reductase